MPKMKNPIDQEKALEILSMQGDKDTLRKFLLHNME